MKTYKLFIESTGCIYTPYKKDKTFHSGSLGYFYIQRRKHDYKTDKHFPEERLCFKFFENGITTFDVFDVSQGCAILLDSGNENAPELREIEIRPIDKEAVEPFMTAFWFFLELNLRKEEEIIIGGKRYPKDRRITKENEYWNDSVDRVGDLNKMFVEKEVTEAVDSSNTLGDLLEKLKPIKKRFNEEMNKYWADYKELKKAEGEGKRFGI